jgi:hypothetical protein
MSERHRDWGRWQVGILWPERTLNAAARHSFRKGYPGCRCRKLLKKRAGEIVTGKFASAAPSR